MTAVCVTFSITLRYYVIHCFITALTFDKDKTHGQLREKIHALIILLLLCIISGLYIKAVSHQDNQ